MLTISLPEDMKLLNENWNTMHKTLIYKSLFMEAAEVWKSAQAFSIAALFRINAWQDSVPAVTEKVSN